jgi:hypothetical protein
MAHVQRKREKHPQKFAKPFRSGLNWHSMCFLLLKIHLENSKYYLPLLSLLAINQLIPDLLLCMPNISLSLSLSLSLFQNVEMGGSHKALTQLLHWCILKGTSYLQISLLRKRRDLMSILLKSGWEGNYAYL